MKTKKAGAIDISINAKKRAVAQNCKVKRFWLYELSANSLLYVYPI